MRLLLASRNAAKLAELRRVLEAAGVASGSGSSDQSGTGSNVRPSVELLGLADVAAFDEVPETGLTFVANALIKAREALARTGLAAVTTGPTWKLGEGTGREYAAVSGDWNPIHVHALTARPLGFPTAIAHGMYSYARVLAALGPRLPEGGLTSRVWFRKPVRLPSTVRLRTARVHEQDCEVCETEEVGPNDLEREIELTGALTDEQRERLLAIADRCPEKQTLERGIKVERSAG